MTLYSLPKLTLLLCLASAGVFAQNHSTPSPYVFNQFIQGTVMQKGGATVQASLNYNTITQEMLFEQDGKKIVMDQANTDTIYLEKRKFVPARQVYFEKLTNTTIPLYVQYISKAVFQKQSKNNELSNVYQSGGKKVDVQQVDPYSLQLPSNYILKHDNKYWVKQGLEFIQISSVKKLSSLFPGKEAQMNEFVKANNIDLGKQEDLVKLIEFANK